MDKYVLMSRNDEVAVLTIDGQMKIKEILDVDRLPIPVQYASDKDKALNDFFIRKLINSDRDNLPKLLSKAGMSEISEAAFANHFLSLSDQFWIKTDKEDLDWENINFFDNTYPQDAGNVFFGYDVSDPCIISPDISTAGALTKTWRRINNKNYLIKAGKFPYFQEPENEVFASVVASKVCRSKFVRYSLLKINDQKASICESFLNEHTTMITAYDLLLTIPRLPEETTYDHLARCAHYFHIKNYKHDIHSMIAFDYVIGNFDRHLGNFGFLYDLDLQKFTTMAPLFDNGSSLWGDTKTNLIPKTMKDTAKPFSIDHDAQIEFISDVKTAINIKALESLKDTLPEYYASYIDSDSDRIQNLSNKFNQRIDTAIKVFSEMKEKQITKEKFKAYLER